MALELARINRGSNELCAPAVLVSWLLDVAGFLPVPDMGRSLRFESSVAGRLAFDLLLTKTVLTSLISLSTSSLQLSSVAAFTIGDISLLH